MMADEWEITIGMKNMEVGDRLSSAIDVANLRCNMKFSENEEKYLEPLPSSQAATIFKHS
uniref:Bm10405 n=1 Tax=Brugia malayi TaxID=6279 RepID=A0A0J9XYJ5_BRUMA|nr:Bm10405 [Brugia malayi]